jgi:hypothetical protein
VAVACLQDRLVIRVVEPAAKLSEIQRAQAVIDDASLPARRASVLGVFDVVMKAGDRAPALFRAWIDLVRSEGSSRPMPFAQDPRILVALATASVST